MLRTKRSIFSSAIALLLCFAMLLGTTYAWFTDSAISGNNVIQSGTLDVEMYWSDSLLAADSDQWQNADGTPIFTYDKWEPGVTEVKYIKVKNAGNLSMQWRLFIEAEGTVGELADVIDVYYINPVTASIETLHDKTSVGVLTDVLTDHKYTGGVLLPAGQSSTTHTVGETILAVAFHMQEDAGNAYQGKSIGDGFSVNLIATQFAYESDAFGPNYDQNAQWPNNVVVGGNSASAAVTPDANNKVSSAVSMTSSNGVISASVPAGVKLTAGTNKLTLNVSDVTDSKANISLNASEASMSIDVHIDGVAEDNDVVMAIAMKELLPVGLNMGNHRFYHVEDGNTVEMTLLSAGATPVHNNYEYDPATGDVVLHLKSFSEVALVSDTENAWNGTVATGFAGGEGTEEAPYIIANADQFVYFGDVISNDNANYGKKHYKLIANINLGGETNANEGKIFYPIGYHKEGGTIAMADMDDAPVFVYHEEDADYAQMRVAVASEEDATKWYTFGGAFEGVFDGDGHTISNIYQNTWQLKGNYSGNYWNAAMGIFGYVYGGKIKNLTVNNFTSDGEFTPTGVIAAYAAGDATFENIAITKCNPRVYNTGNGGIIGIAGDTGAANDDHIILKNITVDNSNKISALWGSWDVACGGLVGMYRGNVDGSGNATGDTIKFENCHISAQIDVYNDVCANYQYYAYRYSGMMIGSVRHNTTSDGKTIPNMTGISATGCTVHFGTWNDYYYCEIIDNTTASYTHDYQMSRLTEIKAINGTTITYLDGTTGTVPASGRANYVIVDYTKGHGTANATCYHFKDGVVWSHENGGKETINGVEVLKEDKQHLYLEFNNLFTGYGWGVSSMAIDKWNGITALDVTTGDQEASVKKFEVIENKLTNNREYKLGDIFAYIEDCGVKLVPGALTVTITNLDENGNVSATIVYDRENWENSTISFIGTGEIKITIQDYYFCTPTTITVDVTERQPEVKFDVVMNNSDFLHRVGNSGTVALNKLFGAKNGATIGTVAVAFETVEGNAYGTYAPNATWANGTIQFSGTGVVKVTITDNDYCIPTELYLEVVDATNVTGLSGTISGNVVLLNNCSISSLTVSGRNTVYGNGFTATYSGNGQYLNNGLKQGVITVSDNGTLDNLRIKAPVYPRAYLYYGATLLGDYVQGGPSSVEGDKTRYHYQLSAVVAKGNATISNCYIYGGRNNIFVDTGDVTIKDTILECGTVANVQIQSSSSHTITLEDVTTIQYKVNATIVETTKVMLGAGIIVGPETTENPTIVLNGEFKQYNWVSAEDKSVVNDKVVQTIIDTALDEADYQHTVNGKTSANLGIIFMNGSNVIIENNTDLPYEGKTITTAGQTGQVYSLKNASAAQIYSDYEKADRATVNGLYQPQFKYDSTLGNQYVEEGGDEHCYREGDTIYVMFPSGDTKVLDLAALVNIAKYAGQNLKLAITCKDSDDNAVTVTDGKVTLSAAGEYTVTYAVTDTLFYDKDGETVTRTEEYSWNVTLSVSLKDTKIPDAYFAFDSTKQKMGYYKPNLGDVKQYIPFLAGLKIYDYNGQTSYLRFDGDTDFNKVASIEVTNKYSGNDALIVVKLTDGGTITLQLLARADSGGGSTYTGKIKTSNNTIYFVSDSGTSNKEATTTAAYWYVDYYKFTGNNGVAIQSAQQTFNSTGSSASTPSGNFSTTIKYTVTYEANGGNCGQTTGYATSASATVTLPTPTRSGYIFAGWYTAAEGGTRVGGAGDSYTPSANITLYAQWGKPCTVTYDANGGDCGTASEKYNGTALTLPTPTRDGYWFIGWYDAATGGNKIGDAGATYNPTGETTLYAHWQEAIKYTVTYNANGGSCGTTSATYEGTALTLPTPTRTGYNFLGWYTAATGGTKIGDAGANYMPSANITLYAQWEIASYTITVTTNNATVKVNGTTVNNNGTVSIQYGTQVTVEVTYSESDNRSTTISGTDGTTYTSPFTMPAQNVTINATSSSCVTPDTLITLADGTQVRVDSLTGKEELLVWNMETGKLDKAPILFVDSEAEAEYEIVHLYFSDGTDVKVIYEHGFWDYDLNKYVYLDRNAAAYIGHTFAKQNGNALEKATLVDVVIETEVTTAWSPVTAGHLCYFVNGMLSMPGGVGGLFNIFDVDAETMTYDYEAMQKDIEKYGLYTYEELNAICPLSEEMFNAAGGAYLKVSIGKGNLTESELFAMINRYSKFFN